MMQLDKPYLSLYFCLLFTSSSLNLFFICICTRSANFEIQLFLKNPGSRSPLIKRPVVRNANEYSVLFILYLICYSCIFKIIRVFFCFSYFLLFTCISVCLWLCRFFGLIYHLYCCIFVKLNAIVEYFYLFIAFY